MKTLVLKGLENSTKLLPPANSFAVRVVKKGNGTGTGRIAFGFTPWEIQRTLKIKGGVFILDSGAEVTEISPIPSDLNRFYTYKVTGIYGFISFNYLDADNITMFREDVSLNTSDSPEVDYNFNTFNLYDRNMLFAANKNFNRPIYGIRFHKFIGFQNPNGSWQGAEAMTALFQGMPEFNQPVGHLVPNDSKFTSYWFDRASKFNQPLDMWDMSGVIDTGLMFRQAYSFNQDITTWDVSQVLSMDGMFLEASSFNQDISKWNFNKEVRLVNFLTRSGLGSENYGKLLKKLDTMDFTGRVEPKVLSAENLTYLKSYQVNKDSLVAKGWTIADAGASYQ